jgi:hypothetical protein
MTPTKHSKSVLEIDMEGYRQTLDNKGKPQILAEGPANAFDANADVVIVTFDQKDGWATLTVTDNDPDGFVDLRDAFTLFAASRRREDVKKRGRFGQGEKELVALCTDGGTLTVTSTKGYVTFHKDGREEGTTRKTKAGTELSAKLKLNQKQAAQYLKILSYIIPPEDVVFTVNGDVITRPTPVRVALDTLDTVYWDAEGAIHETARKTDVEIFTPAPGEKPHIFELGMPVVEHPGKFHINVQQKVPLNSARDNVKPSYLRKLNEVVFNATFDLLTEEEQQAGWVKDALPNATPEALKSHFDTVWGEDAVRFDPSNPEANKRALEEGRRIVYGRSYGKDTWERVKDEGLVKPSGQEIEIFVPTSLDGVPPIEEDEWTESMWHLANYTKRIGEYLLSFPPRVSFYNQGIAGPAARAMWGHKQIIFNLRHLGKNWPGTASQVDIDELLIHEFAHHYESDHLTDSYNKWTCKLGAKLRDCPFHIKDYRQGQ